MLASPKELPEDLDEVVAVFGATKVWRVRYICSFCIPKGFLYCGNCNLVHKGWQTSRFLKRFEDMLLVLRSGRMAHEFIDREYKGSGRDAEGRPIFISKRVHFSERIAELETLIGRASVCENPDLNIKANLHDYLEEMTSMHYHWKVYLNDGH